MIFLGRLLSIVAKIAPAAAERWRVVIFNTIVSKHAVGFVAQATILWKANRFLSTMPEQDRQTVMRLSGIVPERANV